MRNESPSENSQKCNKTLIFSYLLRFEGELNEDLLEFLVDKVDAELLESVLGEDLEAVDVKDPQVEQIRFLLFIFAWKFHRLIRSLKKIQNIKIYIGDHFCLWIKTDKDEMEYNKNP